MTDYIAEIVSQGHRHRVALRPVSKGSAVFDVATLWAEQDGRIFEAESRAAAEAFVGQLSDRFWVGTDVQSCDTFSVFVDHQLKRIAATLGVPHAELIRDPRDLDALDGVEAAISVSTPTLPEQKLIPHDVEGPSRRKKGKR